MKKRTDAEKIDIHDALMHALDTWLIDDLDCNCNEDSLFCLGGGFGVCDGEVEEVCKKCKAEQFLHMILLDKRFHDAQGETKTSKAGKYPDQMPNA